MGRWQRAVSVALMISKTGNTGGGLHQYIKSGKNKHGLIKVCQEILTTSSWGAWSIEVLASHAGYTRYFTDMIDIPALPAFILCPT